MNWSVGCVVPIYKGKGNPHKCGMNRDISLLSVVRKVYVKKLIDWVLESTERGKCEEQYGFRNDRCCSDPFFVV